MKIKYHISLLSCVFLLLSQAYAQENNLSLPEALSIALENNYSIQLAQNNVEIAQNNTSKELLGYNPTVNAQSGLNSNLANNTQKFNTGESNNTGYAFSYGANASITADYNIVDPSRDISFDQLNEILSMTDLQKRLSIENNIASVMSAYYEVGRQAKNLSLQKSTIELSETRLSRAKVIYEYGQSSRLNTLNAQVDIDRDSIVLMNLHQLLSTSKRNLNAIMGRDVNTPVVVDTTLSYNENLDLNSLIDFAKEHNTQVLIVDKSMKITSMDFDLIDATKKPSLAGSASYSYNYSKSAPGSFFRSTSSNGLGLGLTLRYNIYDGGVRKVQEQNTQLNIEGQMIEKDELLLNIERDITNAWYNYQNAQFIISSEINNIKTNKVNFERTEELYKVGQVGSVDYRQAQLNLLNANNSYINAQYDAKQIEIQLLLLSGKLLENNQNSRT